MKRSKRGAKPGNRNALKHGFYSAAFQERERRLLTQSPAADLSGEIELIRIANLRFLQALNATSAPLDLPTQLAALRAVNLSAQSITSLIRAQALSSALGEHESLSDLLTSIQSAASTKDVSSEESSDEAAPTS